MKLSEKQKEVIRLMRILKRQNQRYYLTELGKTIPL